VVLLSAKKTIGVTQRLSVSVAQTGCARPRDRFAPLLVFGLLTLGLSSGLSAQSVTLAWDRNLAADIAGYRLYCGTASGVYSQTIEVGNVTSAKLSALQAGKSYFFVVTDYNTAGLESPPSNQVLYSVTGGSSTPTPTPAHRPTPTPTITIPPRPSETPRPTPTPTPTPKSNPRDPRTIS
jgi:hypothetical protein